jgi:hypothetical protein
MSQREQSMSKQLLAAALIAVLAGGAGFALGTKQGTTLKSLADSYIGTAGHTKTYISVATFLRKGDAPGALKLLDAMINAGALRLADVPPNLDADAQTHPECFGGNPAVSPSAMRATSNPRVESDALASLTRTR